MFFGTKVEEVIIPDSVRELCDKCENIMFCLDTSGSMCELLNYRFADGVTGMDTSVSLMDKFADELIGCKSGSVCLIIEFSSQVMFTEELGPASDFKSALKNLHKFIGATSMFQAIDLAISKLIERKTTNMRIICITDGYATDLELSKRVAERIVKEKIRLDAVFLTTDIETGLRALAKKTSCIFIRPKTVASIDELVQQEAFFKLTHRQYDLFNSPPFEEVVQTIRQDLGLRVGWMTVPERWV